jgi:hypothetical protein
MHTLTAATGIYDGSPSWSADGTRIAFDSDRYRNGYMFGWGIFVINTECLSLPEGCQGEARFLTEGIRPSWRP